MKDDTKIGVFVLISVAVLAAILIRVGDVPLLRKGYTLQSRMNDVAGLKRHSPVRLAGVEVGTVQSVRVHEDQETAARPEAGRVELVLWIEEDVRVRRDAKVTVATLGLMGEKYVELTGGSAQAPFAQEGDSLAADSPARLEELVATGQQVAQDIGRAAKDIGRAANHLDEALQHNRPHIDRTLENFESTSENVRDFSQDIKFHPWKLLLKGRERKIETPAERDVSERAGPTQNFTSKSR